MPLKTKKLIMNKLSDSKGQQLTAQTDYYKAKN